MIAVDTNLLVHAHQREASFHTRARESIRQLAEAPAPWAICLHSFIEFYAITTHPKIWKKPSAPAEAFSQIEAWRESPSLRVLSDSPGLLDRLQDLAVAAHVRGGMIHDARIAAACLAAGVAEFWTVDRDFSRFPNLKIRNPLV